MQNSLTNDVFEEVIEAVVPLYRAFRSRIEDLSVELKDDNTLLTEADLAVQSVITRIVLAADPKASILGEEGEREPELASRVVWVVDPIDGTAQFTKIASREFCTVLVRTVDGIPTAGLLIAPELASDREPLIVSIAESGQRIEINGSPQEALSPDRPVSNISATRSRGTERRSLEKRAEIEGIAVKHRTTSQSLDLIRLFIDLRPLTDLPLPPFEGFLRKRQWVWDGVLGLLLSQLDGYEATDGKGCALLPLPQTLFLSKSPMFPLSVTGTVSASTWIRNNLEDSDEGS